MPAGGDHERDRMSLPMRAKASYCSAVLLAARLVTCSRAAFATMPNAQNDDRILEQYVARNVIAGHPISDLFWRPLIGRLSDSPAELRMLSKPGNAYPQ